MSDATLARLADYVHRLRFAQLPARAVHAARRRLIDSLACAAAGASQPFCQQMAAFAGRYSGPMSARIWGSGQTCSLEMAAFANGTMLRYLDLSDTVLARSNGHPSDMIGALVAVGEAAGSSGADLLTAVVAAYELYCSLCDSTALAAQGIDQATAAAVGAAGGAAWLLRLDVAQVADALALGLSANLQLYNVRCGALSDWKGCAGPNGARNGVFAALLAQQGVSGPTAPIEGRGGLQTLLGAFDWQPGAGEPLICSTHLKRHAVCYHGQSAVDAALQLRARVPAQEVESLQIETYAAAYEAMGSDAQRWAPSNRETADHSLPYAVAIAWLDGRLSGQAYAPEQLLRADTAALMARITVQAVPALTARFPAQAPTRITVQDRQGRVHSHLQDYPEGHALAPMSDARLEDKFTDLFAPWGNAQQAQQALQLLWRCESLASVTQLVDALCSAPG